MSEDKDNVHHLSERRVPENREDLALLHFLKPMGIRAQVAKEGDEIVTRWPADDNKYLIFRLQGAEQIRQELRSRTDVEGFLRLASAGGKIVSTACMDQLEIAVARDQDRLLVLSDGYGFVWVPPTVGTEKE